MNYTQVITEIEQLKTGKNDIDIFEMLKAYEKIKIGSQLGKMISFQAAYEYDSVGNYCEAILKAHKYIVGRFTTYALKRPCEYIQVNAKAISQKQFAIFGEKILTSDYFEKSHLTQMEVYFLIALFYFDEKKCDYILLPNAMSDVCEISVEEFGIHKRSLVKQIFSFREYENLEVNAASKMEAHNSARAIDILQKEGILLKEKSVKKALLSNVCEGRFEILKSKPYFISDGANGEKATKILMANLQYYFPDNPYIFIMGSRQENYESVVKESALMAQQIITITPPEISDAIPSYELAKEIEKLNQNITNVGGVEEAVELANLLADRNTVVVGFGDCSWLERYKKTVVT